VIFVRGVVVDGNEWRTCVDLVSVEVSLVWLIARLRENDLLCSLTQDSLLLRSVGIPQVGKCRGVSAMMT
jgi:hypothetical protein